MEYINSVIEFVFANSLYSCMVFGGILAVLTWAWSKYTVTVSTFFVGLVFVAFTVIYFKLDIFSSSILFYVIGGLIVSIVMFFNMAFDAAKNVNHEYMAFLKRANSAMPSIKAAQEKYHEWKMKKGESDERGERGHVELLLRNVPNANNIARRVDFNWSFNNPDLQQYMQLVMFNNWLGNNQIALFGGKFDDNYIVDSLMDNLIAKYKEPGFEIDRSIFKYEILTAIMYNRIFVLKDVTFKQFFEEAFLPNVNVYKFVLRMTFVSWPIAVLWLVTHRLCSHFMEIILTVYKKPLNLAAKYVYDYFRKD